MVTPSTVWAVKWLVTQDSIWDAGEVPVDPPPNPPTSRTATATADVVVDLPFGHVPFELGQGRGGVGAVEPADGHDRVAGGQLVARCRVRTRWWPPPTSTGRRRR